ncbi:MAG TPA: MmgE/PrpD family protein [Bryobacteraceae bacterium]|nr:MmgE/PrpD family protein [Bryobacteraceae bacterium]
MRLTRRTLAQTALNGAAALFTSRGFSNAAPMDYQQSSDGLTRYVAEWAAGARFSDVPSEVVQLGKKSILDGLGLAFSGSAATTGDLVRRYLKSLGPVSGSATVIGSDIKCLARFAAFANGVAMHADDYDDTQLAVAKDRVYGLLTHPTTPCLPAALAIAEGGRMSGRELTLAYHVGVEVECKVAEAIAPRHYEEGFHSTGTCGAFGAAAATAKLRGLKPEQIAMALGIAGSQSSGLRENFGTMTKPFQAGHAAECGLVATDFAAMGWTAADNILEAPRGFFQAAGGGYDPDAILHKLGNPWTFAFPGVSIKPFPSGSLTHPGMTLMRGLIRENQIRADQVERVDVGTNRNMPTALIHHQPKDALQAKFSMEFCMAALLLYGSAGLSQFTDETVNRPEVQAMIRRVHFGVNAEAERAGYNKMTTIIDIHLKDGRTVSGRADFGKGSPADPMTYDEVAEKFLDAASYARWPSRKAAGIVDLVRKLEDLPDVRMLTELCAS